MKHGVHNTLLLARVCASARTSASGRCCGAPLYERRSKLSGVKVISFRVITLRLSELTRFARFTQRVEQSAKPCFHETMPVSLTDNHDESVRLLDMSSLLQAQFHHEFFAENARQAQSHGHTTKLVSLLIVAVFRHILWTKAQIPQPTPLLERLLALHLDDTSHVQISYDTALRDMPVQRPRRRRLPALIQRAEHVLHTCTRLEAQIYALLTALASTTHSTFDIAIVTGQSLQFPQHVVLLQCKNMLSDSHDAENALQPHDSFECTNRRRKVSALMERKFVRFCMDESLCPVETQARVTRTRLLILAPANLRVHGWHPRPHWRPPQADCHPSVTSSASASMPASLPRATLASDAAGSSPSTLLPSSDTIPRRVSHMSSAAHELLMRRAISKPSSTVSSLRRKRQDVRPVRICMDGGLPLGDRGSPTQVTWFESDAAVTGFHDASGSVV